MKPLTFPGEALRDRREAQGLSLKDVYDQIHVPLQHVEALERGDIAALPVATYTVGFIVSYCECLGVAPQPYVDRYRTLCDAPVAQALPEDAPRFKPAPMPFTLPALPSHRPGWMADAMAWGTICGIVLLGWITYTVMLKPATVDDSRVEAGTQEVTAPEYPEFHFLEEDLGAPVAKD